MNLVRLVDDINNIGPVFREVRGDLSQRDFARRLDISKSMLAAIETGRRIPSVRIIEKLRRYVEMRDLIQKLPPVTFSKEFTDQLMEAGKNFIKQGG